MARTTRAASRTGPRTPSLAVRALAIGLLCTGGITAVGPVPAASAVPRATAPERAPGAAGAVAEQPSAITAAAADAARDRVLRLAKSGLPAEIRTSAWNALRSTRGDAAIDEWLAPGGGYDAAKQRLRDARSRNRAFCERVVRTHPAGFAPETRAAAERALKGPDSDRVAFVRTGYAEAQRRDRAVREADAQRGRDVTEREREFVRTVAERDPGEHVRAAAQWAVRPGATDGEVAEFFGYGWADGAVLDLEAYQVRIADAEVRRHHLLARLVAQATAAERALESAADTARARDEAERAWRAVAGHADTARTAWLAERESARAQAENWRSNAEAAKESAGAVWKDIAAPAGTRRDDWSKEQSEAVEAAAFWTGMFDRALDSETRVRG